MSTGYQDVGRTKQKQRTRDALVAAARELVTQGLAPSVDAVARHAGISRTTAYRYFPTQRELLAAAHPETAMASLLPEHSPTDVETRLDHVVGSFIDLILRTELQQRTMLRLSLDVATTESDLPLRQGRAIVWIEEALQPLQTTMTDADIRRLALAVRSATGIEALVWLTDVGGLPRDEAAALMKWSARALLRAAADAAVAAPT